MLPSIEDDVQEFLKTSAVQNIDNVINKIHCKASLSRIGVIAFGREFSEHEFQNKINARYKQEIEKAKMFCDKGEIEQMLSNMF